MIRRGFSLLEVVIALALLVALGGLVGLAMLPLRDEQVREQTLTQLAESIRLASYDARREGAAARLVARTREDGRFEIVAVALADDDSPAARPSRREGGRPDRSADAEGGGNASGRSLGAGRSGESAGHVLMSLPADWRITRSREEALARVLEEQQPAQPAASASMAPPASDDLPRESFFIPDALAPEGEELTLAVLLPDGSAIVGDAAYVLPARGRPARLELSPWTGEPTLGAVSEEDEPHADDPLEETPEPPIGPDGGAFGEDAPAGTGAPAGPGPGGGP